MLDLPRLPTPSPLFHDHVIPILPEVAQFGCGQILSLGQVLLLVDLDGRGGSKSSHDNRVNPMSARVKSSPRTLDPPRCNFGSDSCGARLDVRLGQIKEKDHGGQGF